MTSNNNKSIAPPNNPTIEQIQNDFGKVFGFGREIIFDHYSCEQGERLKSKINQIFPDQKKNKRAIIKKRDDIFNSIWAQRRYTNGNLLMTTIFVCVTEDPLDTAEKSITYSIHPVFRTRKCTPNEDENNSDNYCMIFVDELGRVYQNWNEFKNKNKLPKGVMVAPTNGIYVFDVNHEDIEEISLEKCATPASSILAKCRNIGDTVATVASVASGCVAIGGTLAIATVAAPVVAGAAVVGIAAGTFVTARSAHELYDRAQHEQPINIRDSNARSSWYGAVGGIIGMTGAGLTKTMTELSSLGKNVSEGFQFVTNGVNISSMFLSGASLLDSAVFMIFKWKDNEDISFLDAAQLAASFVFFTHSAYNFRMASKIIQETQSGSITSIRDGLSRNQRNRFDQLAKETIRIHGEAKGKQYILRGFNEMPSSQFLNDLHKIRKELTERGIRPSFGANEGERIVLNNQVPIDTQHVRQNIQNNVGSSVLDNVNAPLPPSMDPSINNVAARNQQYARILLNNSVDLAPGVSVYITENSARVFEFSNLSFNFFYRIRDIEYFKYITERLMEILEDEVYERVLQLADQFITYAFEEFDRELRSLINTETVLYRILDYLRRKIQVYTIEVIEQLSSIIIDKLKSYFITLDPNNQSGNWKLCNNCSGRFYVFDI